MPRQSPYVITLTPDERKSLEARARRYTLAYREVVRAQIVLLAAEGLENKEIAARLNMRREHRSLAIRAKSSFGIRTAPQPPEVSWRPESSSTKHVGAIREV